MHFSRRSGLLARVFYALVIFFSSSGWAELSWSEIQLLEFRARQPVTRDSAQAFLELENFYEKTGRLQELAWLMYARDDESPEAAALEKKIRRILQTERYDLEPMFKNRKNLSLARFAGGLRAVVSHLDLASTGYYRDSFGDSRHYAVIYGLAARKMGAHITPSVVHRHEGRGVVSVRAYIRDAVAGPENGDGYFTIFYEDEALHVLDYLFDHRDRTSANFGRHPGGYVVAWDNDAILDSPLAQVLRPQRPHLGAANPPRTLSPRAREGVLALKNALEFDLASLRIDTKNANDVLVRVRHLLALPCVDALEVGSAPR